MPRMTAIGTSFCGLVISSPAALGCSKPTRLKNSTGTRAMKAAHEGVHSLASGMCRPYFTPYTIVVRPNRITRSMRHQAPTVGIHLPTPKDRIADHTENQM